MTTKCCHLLTFIVQFYHFLVCFCFLEYNVCHVSYYLWNLCIVWRRQTTSCQQEKQDKHSRSTSCKQLKQYAMEKKVNQSCNELTLHGRSKNKSLALNKSVIKLLQNTRFKFHSCLYVPDWACLITSRPLDQSYHRLRLSSILVSYHRHQDHFLPHWVWLGLVQR